MNAAFVPSGDVTALPAAPPRPPPPPRPPRAPPRPPRPAASASAAEGTPGQFDRDASQTTRLRFAGSTRTTSLPLRYQKRSSDSQVAATLPPTTRLVSDGASI